ncbi:MAG: L-serine ammonia-lyase, iron-sulfur-dependent, subunit alpha [Tissierellia bacterium]|nr:L-serine ammonia-lyase, iron-sulfur-dependent, subunit alpha [Tissierellia bacterium]
MKSKKNLLEILHNQVKPALGCTEPGAVSLAVAKAKEILGEEVLEATVYVNKSILKNGMSVGIPGTSESGLYYATALAIIIGKSEYGLEVLKDVDESSLEPAKKLIDEGKIKIELKDVPELYVGALVKGKNHEAEAIIRDLHNKFVYFRKDDNILLDDMNIEQNTKEKAPDLRMQIQNYSIDELIDFAKNVDIEDISFIKDGIDMNLKLANVALNEEIGIGIAKLLYSKVDGDKYKKAKALTAAASEARMSGYPLPVMSSAGSGNHGLVAIVPISVLGLEDKFSMEEILRAVTLSHLITIFVKSYLGPLSPVCGCGVAAGVGASCGITMLYGGTNEQIEMAIHNVVASITGMICDGAKIGCAMKLASAVNASIDAHQLAIQNIKIPAIDGILGNTAKESIVNLAKVSHEGMNNTDCSILEIMLEK